MSKTLRLYSCFPFLRGYQKPSKTVKNSQSLQLFWFFEGPIAPPKTIKNHQKPSKTLRLYSYFLFLRGYIKPSKTVKNPQTLQLFSFFEGSLAPPKTIKNHQKTSKALRLHSYFPFMRGYQKSSKTGKNPQRLYSYSHFLRGLQLLLNPSKTIKKCQKPLYYTVISYF